MDGVHLPQSWRVTKEDTFILQSVILVEAAPQLLIGKKEITCHLKQN